MTGKKTKYAPEAYGYIAPISIILIVFVGISVVLSIVLSFSKYNILLPPEFNGLENYQRLFSDTKFLTALTNTLKLLVYIVPLQTVLALLISAPVSYTQLDVYKRQRLCSLPEMSLATLSLATTTPTARTTRSPG